MENPKRILSQFTLVIGMLLLVSCSKAPNSSEENFDVVREVTYSFRLQKNRSSSSRMVADLYLPVTQEGRQKLLSYSISGTIKQKPRAVTDELGNQYLHYEFDDLPPGFVGTVKVKARVGLNAPQVLHDETGFKDVPDLHFSSGKQAFLSDIGLTISEYRQALLSNTEKNTCASHAQVFLAIAKSYKLNSEAVVGIGRDESQDEPLTCWIRLYNEENDVLVDLAAGEFFDDREVGIRAFKSLESVESVPLKNLLSAVYGLSVDLSFDK